MFVFAELVRVLGVVILAAAVLLMLRRT